MAGAARAARTVALAALACACDDGHSPAASTPFDAGRVVAEIPLEFSEGVMSPDGSYVAVWDLPNATPWRQFKWAAFRLASRSHPMAACSTSPTC